MLQIPHGGEIVKGQRELRKLQEHVCPCSGNMWLLALSVGWCTKLPV